MSQSLFQHTKHEEYCPQCGAPLQMKQGKKGLFLGCSAYPSCDYLRPLHKVEHKVLKELDETCPQCGNPLQLKQGAFGMFIGCSHYPDCDFVVHEQQDEEQSIVVAITFPIANFPYRQNPTPCPVHNAIFH